MEWTSSTGAKILLREGDITRVRVDAIVNAANSALAGGGGVDGAIHARGGPHIMRELDGIRARIGRCAPGSALATSAGRLPAQFVFHAVGPIYRGGSSGEAEQLASCYRTCLRMAEERTVRSISFPAISTGAYGYPMHEAAEIAIREVKAHLENPASTVREVIFVVFSREMFRIYAAKLNS